MRVVVGTGLIVLATVDWQADWLEPLIGFVHAVFVKDDRWRTIGHVPG